MVVEDATVTHETLELELELFGEAAEVDVGVGGAWHDKKAEYGL